MTVRTEIREVGEVAVVADGDITSPAMLVQLHAALTQVAFSASAPVVVDLSATTGSSAAVRRLLDRMATVMRRRGVAFRVGQPPATAGMIETVAPSGVGVCRPPANRTSSSPT